MKIRVLIVTAAGLALVLYLLMRVGLGAVIAAAVTVGWSGFAGLCFYALGLFVLLGAAWYVLLPDDRRPALRVWVWARMVRDAGAEVLPISQLGGIVLGARAAILQGVGAPLAFASVVVDVTTELLAQIAYVAFGVALLSLHAPQTSQAVSLIRIFAIGFLLAAVAGALFLAVQRYGHRVTANLAVRFLPGAAATLSAVAAELDAIYRSKARVALSSALHLAGWIASAIWTWIAFRLIGAHVDLISALAIESLVYATRSAAAFMPSALGVQEAAYAVLAPLFGTGAEFGLALSLLKRARDIAMGVPILLIWQAMEGRRVLGGPAQSI